MANVLVAQRRGSERERRPRPLQRPVRQPGSPKHEPYLRVVSDDLLDDVKERLALTRLGPRQPRLHLGNVRSMACREVFPQPGGLSGMSKVVDASHGADKSELIFLFPGPREVIVEGVEIPVPLPADPLDEAGVGRLHEVVERLYPSSIN